MHVQVMRMILRQSKWIQATDHSIAEIDAIYDKFPHPLRAYFSWSWDIKKLMDPEIVRCIEEWEKI
jgi:hypothetical protein